MARYTIDAGTFARNALKAQADGRMGYHFQEYRLARECHYLYPNGACCAIGAGFPTEQAAELNALGFGPIQFGLDGGAVSVTSETVPPDVIRRMLINIQRNHDALVDWETPPDEFKQREATLAIQLTELSLLHPEPMEIDPADVHG